ncbi:MAG TPA: dihydrofolate reductase family protein [Ilumatobacteraceae bacterium]|nr:dihydrofolate reductase family protein [Ilumatobacteraceae bacterium]
MRRLFPHSDDIVTLRECYDVPRPRPSDRPWVALCMVAGLDGSTVVDRSSRGLSNPTDQELFLTMRSFADVILVGAGTVRAEGYGPPRLPGQRIAIVSQSGNFDFGLPLFTSGQALLVMPTDAPEVPVPSVRAGIGGVDIAAALAQLDADVVEAEGGSVLNGLLAAADLIDELNLTISPQISGGAGARVTSGAPPLSHRMTLAHVLEDDGFLFTRYVRAR